MSGVPLRAQQPALLGGDEEDQDASTERLPQPGEGPRNLEDAPHPGSVVRRAVVDAVPVHRLADAHVVQVGAVDHHLLAAGGGRVAGQQRDDVLGGDPANLALPADAGAQPQREAARLALRRGLDQLRDRLRPPRLSQDCLERRRVDQRLGQKRRGVLQPHRIEAVVAREQRERGEGLLGRRPHPDQRPGSTAHEIARDALSLSVHGRRQGGEEVRPLRPRRTGEREDDLVPDVHLGEVVVAVLGDRERVAGEDRLCGDVGHALVHVGDQEHVLIRDQTGRRAGPAGELQRARHGRRPYEGDLLEIRPRLSGRREPHRLKLARDVAGGDVVPVRARVATRELVVGQEADVAGDGLGPDARRGGPGRVAEAVGVHGRSGGPRCGGGAGQGQAEKEGGKAHESCGANHGRPLRRGGVCSQLPGRGWKKLPGRSRTLSARCAADSPSRNWNRASAAAGPWSRSASQWSAARW